MSGRPISPRVRAFQPRSAGTESRLAMESAAQRPLALVQRARTGSGVRPLHIAASLLIAATWGLNFTVIRFGLDEFTPFAFAGWRFVLGALPVLVLPRPAISWKALIGTGMFLFAGQFVFLFYAMEAGLPPGLSSVLVQLQGPLTLVLAAVALRERSTN